MTDLELYRAQLAVPLTALVSSAGTVVVPGPETLAVFGVGVPVLSAIFGIVGVVLGQLLAPAPATPLSARRTVALFLSLIGLELGIVIATGQLPLVAMAWGMGLGFSGLPVAATLGDQALKGIRAITDAFINRIAGRAGDTKKEDPDA